MIQGTKEWHKARAGRFTGSGVYKLLVQPRSKSDREAGVLSETAKSYILEKAYERISGHYQDVSSAAIEWGNDHEDDARMYYEADTGNQVTEVGFLEWGEFGGGSPDGLVGDDGMIEIKCPFNGVNHLRYIMSEDFAKEYKDHYCQMQNYMMVTGRSWCDFISYDPRIPGPGKMFIKRIERDDDMIQRLHEAIEKASELMKTTIQKIKIRTL